MISMIIGRKHELLYLEEQYKKKTFQNIVVFGRRRVGKTMLVLDFLKSKTGSYLLLQKTPNQAQVLVNKFAKEQNIFPQQVTTFSEAFKFIKEHVTGQYIIILDEFPYLIENDPSILSQFQSIIDEELKDSQIFLILLGSSISIMENEVLSYKSPLYARRTGQIYLKPFSISELIEYFPSKTMQEIIEVYGVFDSIPAYLSLLDKGGSIFEDIEKHLLTKESFLFQEVDFLLNQELREPSVYKAILLAISLGKQRITDISHETGISQNVLTKYISTLLTLHIIKKKHPVTDKELSRNTLYDFEDNYFRFYFRFIYPNLSLLEERKTKVLLSKIKKEFNSYIGGVFEQVCRKYVSKMGEYLKVGSYWKKGEEIDVVALGQTNLIAECKYKESVDYKKELDKLKSKTIPIAGEYTIFAKQFTDKNGVDLKIMYKEFMKVKKQ